jgi:hypothetical protein
MKSALKALSILLLAALPCSLIAQNPSVIVAYMKVKPESVNDYLEVEKAWKKLHVKAIEAGVHNGWQLWRNIHAGADDPYQYITIQWYDSYDHTFGENNPEGWWEGVFSEQEQTELNKKAYASRSYAFEDVSHQLVSVDNPENFKYLLVSRNQIPPGRYEDYIKMETEIFKPVHEEMIRKDMMAHWGVWQTWPFKEGQARITIVEGYINAAQMSSPGFLEVFKSIHPDLIWEEVVEEIQKNRKELSVEMWELIDSVFPD